MITRIYIFGDSITHGAWDEEMGGWADRLKVFLNNKWSETNEYEVYNLGVDNNTAEDLLDRFEFEVYQRATDSIEEIKNIFIFAIGINDSAYFKENDSNRISLDQFQENIQYLTALAKKYSENIIFIGLTPVIEEKVSKSYADDSINYKNKFIGKYNNTVRSVCEKDNLIFIDILKEFQKSDYKSLLDEDGLHPNSLGHKKITEIVQKILTQNEFI